MKNLIIEQIRRISSEVEETCSKAQRIEEENEEKSRRFDEYTQKIRKKIEEE